MLKKTFSNSIKLLSKEILKEIIDEISLLINLFKDVKKNTKKELKEVFGETYDNIKNIYNEMLHDLEVNNETLQMKLRYYCHQSYFPIQFMKNPSNKIFNQILQVIPKTENYYNHFLPYTEIINKKIHISRLLNDRKLQMLINLFNNNTNILNEYEHLTLNDNYIRKFKLPFTKSLNKLEYLTINDSNLNEFFVHQNYKNLRSINLSDNNLKKIIIANSNLKELILSSNKLQYVFLHKLNNLESLQLYKNRLKYIDLICTSKNLKTLCLKKNLLKNIEFINFIKLTELNLAYNLLFKIKLLNLPNLQDLNLSNNKFTNLEISNLPNLLNLWLNSNNLTTLKLSNLPKLTLLSLDNNKFTILKLPNLPKLTLLNLKNNKLCKINLLNTPNLTKINLSDNYLKKLIIPNLKNLTRLDLDNNPLEDLILPKPIKLSGLYLQGNSLNILNHSFLSLLRATPENCWLNFIPNRNILAKNSEFIALWKFYLFLLYFEPVLIKDFIKNLYKQPSNNNPWDFIDNDILNIVQFSMHSKNKTYLRFNNIGIIQNTAFKYNSLKNWEDIIGIGRYKIKIGNKRDMLKSLTLNLNYYVINCKNMVKQHMEVALAKNVNRIKDELLILFHKLLLIQKYKHNILANDIIFHIILDELEGNLFTTLKKEAISLQKWNNYFFPNDFVKQFQQQCEIFNGSTPYACNENYKNYENYENLKFEYKYMINEESKKFYQLCNKLIAKI